jgi:FKBP-type peptidyl-prolyl cis-trans isomerase SlyD
LEYTVKLQDQSVFGSNVGETPLTYTHGAGKIIPGLEKALDGMAVGATK